MTTIAAVVLVVACQTTSLSAQAPTTADTLTLDQAVSMALSANRLLKAADLMAERADKEAAALRTRRFPALDFKGLGGSLLAPLVFNFPAGSLGTYPATGPIPFSDTEISSPARPVAMVLATATQPLTQLKRINLGSQILALDGDIAREQSRQVRAQLISDVKKVYVGLLRAEAGLATLTDARTLLDEVKREVSEYVAREVALPGDALTVDSRLADVELKQVGAENQRDSLREQLNVLLGRDLETPFAVVLPPLTPLSVDLTAAQASAVANRPEVHDADLKARQAGLNVQVKHAALTPDVSLTGGYLGLYNAVVVPHNTAAIGIWVSWEPWDWGRRKLETEAGQRQASAAELGRDEARARVRADVSAKFRRVAEARAELRVAETSGALSAEHLRVARERYKQDSMLLKDVLEAQLAVSESRQKTIDAEAAVWVARAELEQAMGDPTP